MKPTEQNPLTEDLQCEIPEAELVPPAEHACCGKCQEPEISEKPETSQNQDELMQVKASEQEIKDKYLRLHAEFDNYRRRTAREQIELIETANGKLLEKLSEVVDNFERAFTQSNKDVEAFEKGIQLIQEQFLRILKDFGLESIDPAGEKFDPNFHEAFLKQPSDSVTEGNVITVFQKGYRIKQKILKTAKVIVSSGPAATGKA